jgi:hypothetical protein
MTVAEQDHLNSTRPFRAAGIAADDDQRMRIDVGVAQRIPFFQGCQRASSMNEKVSEEQLVCRGTGIDVEIDNVKSRLFRWFDSRCNRLLE